MSDTPLYLKPNAAIEPLVSRWYAWTYTIAPATSSLYLANSQMKIMESFVNSPQMHVAALKNPAMLGGPFVNYPADRVREVAALMEATAAERAPALEFADALKKTGELLAQEGNGSSLEPLYEKLPDPVRGFVELNYDTSDHPGVRVIEPLLYKSRHYDSSAQSITLKLVESDSRPFVISTPRLASEAELNLQIPFASRQLDDLFRMRTTPAPFDTACELVGVSGAKRELFHRLFTDTPPPPRAPFEGARIRYFGHATVLIESGGLSVLTDPIVSYRFETPLARFTFEDLPERIDYVLITHLHQDHVSYETLLQLRHRIGTVVVPRCGIALCDPSLKLVLRNLGFSNVMEIDDMETIGEGPLRITGIPFLGEHSDLNIRAKSVYLVEADGQKVLCVADSNNLEPRLYENVHRETGDVDIVFIGMECDGAPMSWLYGPLLSKPPVRKVDQSRRLDGSNFERAWALTRQFRPKQAYVYAMGAEPWLSHMSAIRYTDTSRPIVESNRFIEKCRAAGIEAERLYCRKEVSLRAAAQAA